MRRILPAVVLLVWSAWLASAYLTHGRDSYIRQHDTAEVNTPYYIALPQLHARGLVGLRDPLGGTGIDALSNLKGDLPLVEVFFTAWPHWSNSGLLLLCQTFAAALGVYLLARRTFGLSRAPSLTAAAWLALLPWVGIAYSGYPTWYGFSVAAVPWTLLVLTRESRRPASPRLLAVLCGLLAALGTPTASGGAIITIVALALVVFTPRGRRREAALLSALFAIAFLFAKLLTIVALLSTAPESHRLVRAQLPFGIADTAGLWAWRVVETKELLLPYALPLGIAALGWLFAGTHRRHLRVCLGIVIALAVVTLAAPLAQDVQGALGGAFRSYALERVNRFTPVFIVLAAAFALEDLRKRQGYVLLVAVSTISLAVISLEMNRRRENDRQKGDRYSAFFEDATLHALAARQTREDLFRVATFADRNANHFGQHAAFAWAYGLETADVYCTIYSLRYHRFWDRVIAPATNARPDIRDYFGRWGNMAYLFNPSAQLFDPFVEPQDPSLRPAPFNTALLALANVRYVVSRVPIHDPALSPRPSSSNLLLYEHATPLPRFFVVHRWQRFESPDALLDVLERSTPAQLRTTALLEDEPRGITATPDAPPSTVTVARYEADRIELDVVTPAPGLLIASNAYMQHWRARVNDEPADVIPAYHAFLAVPVPAGTHRLRLDYAPPHAAWASAHAIASGLSILITIVTIAVLQLCTRRPTEAARARKAVV